MSDKQDELRPIIVKKIKKAAHGHHGGAWKVAYADFVTAMMAFFLMLWLLSSTTEVQKEGIAEYFTSTPMITRSEDGSNGILGGTTISKDGAMTSTVKPLVTQPETQDPALRPGDPIQNDDANISDERFAAELKKREEENFKRTQAALEAAIKADPELAAMKDSLKIDTTPEGLRIQILDQEKRPLFASGSANLLPETKDILRKVSAIIQRLPNEVSVRGHTDSIPYGPGANYTNWELSADRANSARRALRSYGMPAARLNNVVGKADTDHLYTDDPRDARNRRISIILLHEGIVVEEGANKSTRAVTRKEKTERQLYQRTEGKVEFP